MKLGDFLQNPSGKGSAMFYNRYEAIRRMESRLNNYLTISHSKTGKRIFNYNIFKDKNKYIFLFRLPSETLKDLHYDILVEFSPTKESPPSSLSIKNYNVRFFSNSPHFIFTYAYVMNKSKLLFNPCKKINRKALNKRPAVRNPIEIMGYEKSIYSCALFIDRNGKNLYDKQYLDAHSTPWDHRKVCKTIMSDVQKKDQYDRINKKLKDKKKPEKNAPTVAKNQLKPEKEFKSKVVGRPKKGLFGSKVKGGNIIRGKKNRSRKKRSNVFGGPVNKNRR